MRFPGREPPAVLGSYQVHARRAACSSSPQHQLFRVSFLLARKLGTRTVIEAESLRSFAAGLPALPRKTP